MVDPAAVMQEIRQKVLSDEGPAVPSPTRPIPPSSPEREIGPPSPELAGAVAQLNDLFILDGEPPLRSHRPGRAWLVRPIKRLLGKLLKWYVRPIAMHQTSVNAQSVRAWNALVTSELPRLNQRLEALEARLARLESAPPSGRGAGGDSE